MPHMKQYEIDGVVPKALSQPEDHDDQIQWLSNITNMMVKRLSKEPDMLDFIDATSFDNSLIRGGTTVGGQLRDCFYIIMFTYSINETEFSFCFDENMNLSMDAIYETFKEMAMKCRDVYNKSSSSSTATISYDTVRDHIGNRARRWYFINVWNPDGPTTYSVRDLIPYLNGDSEYDSYSHDECDGHIIGAEYVPVLTRHLDTIRSTLGQALGELE